MQKSYVNLSKVFAVIGFCSLMACSPSSSNNPVDQKAKPQTGLEDPANPNAPIPGSGAEVRALAVDSKAIALPDASDPNASVDDVVAEHPELMTQTDFLGTITRVVETDAGTFDLYAGEELVLVLERNTTDATLAVKDSINNFSAESILWMAANPADAASMDAVSFVLTHCKAATELPPEQDQKGKPEPTPTPAPEDPVPVPAPLCASLKMDLTLKAIVPDNDQDQDQDQK